MQEILTGASPQATLLLIEAWTAHTDASDVLDGLSPEQALTKLEGWPHSIAEQVAHMLFWQRQAHLVIETGSAPDVPTAADGWPQVTQSDWPRIKDEFLGALEKNREMTRTPGKLNQIYRDNITVGVRLLTLVTHDSYHLGQVVLMRRLIGAWPPPNGGDTW